MWDYSTNSETVWQKESFLCPTNGDKSSSLFNDKNSGVVTVVPS